MRGPIWYRRFALKMTDLLWVNIYSCTSSFEEWFSPPMIMMIRSIFVFKRVPYWNWVRKWFREFSSKIDLMGNWKRMTRRAQTKAIFSSLFPLVSSQKNGQIFEFSLFSDSSKRATLSLRSSKVLFASSSFPHPIPLHPRANQATKRERKLKREVVSFSSCFSSQFWRYELFNRKISGGR